VEQFDVVVVGGGIAGSALLGYEGQPGNQGG
jgi:L-2-hydroxyglutarate oxidase LhgO